MNRYGRRALAIGLTVLVAAPLFSCASSGRELEPRNARHLSAQEIESYGISLDLYSFVQRARPIWLRRTGPHSITGGDDIRVYVNGMGYSTPLALRFYHASDVESMTFLDPGRATVRFGTGHSHGAIVVRMRGGGLEAP